MLMNTLLSPIFLTQHIFIYLFPGSFLKPEDEYLIFIFNFRESLVRSQDETIRLIS